MYYNQNPYMNPYNYQNSYIQNPYNQVNPYMTQQQPVQTVQSVPTVQPIPQIQPATATIPGQMVDSFEAAKAKDIDMSGNPRYYPNLNGNEIYVKQLQADGTCQTVTYRKVIDQPTPPAAPAQQVNIDPVVAVINDMRQQIVQEVIEAVKQTIGS